MMTGNDIVLLVEDNSDDVIFMQRAFKTAEISQPLAIVEDGRAAIDFLQQSDPAHSTPPRLAPRLILIDLKLPYTSGLELLLWIREQPFLKGVVVLVFTTSGEDSDVEKSYLLGANAYLIKPANMNELLNILRAIKTFWIDHNVYPRRRFSLT